jgi:hypothetical protein
MKNVILPFFSLLIIGSLALSCQDHGIGTDDPSGVKVFGLNEKIDGLGYKEINEISIKWSFPASIDDSPLNDSTGSRSAANLQPLANVMILATNLGGVSTRSLTIPSGRNVFFTIAGAINFYYDNDLCDPTFHPAPGQSPADFLTGEIEPGIDAVENMTAQLDGKDLVVDLKRYKINTGIFPFIAPKEFTNPNCDYTNRIANALDISYALLIKIPKGKHILTYKADFPGTPVFHTEVTWNLTVE